LKDTVMGAIPRLPNVVPHGPLVDYQIDDDGIQWLAQGAFPTISAGTGSARAVERARSSAA